MDTGAGITINVAQGKMELLKRNSRDVISSSRFADSMVHLFAPLIDLQD